MKRAAFERWLRDTYCEDDPIWEEARNCYKEPHVHLAWQAWRAAAEHPHAIVERQANDPGLWFEAQTAPEAYLQRALRELHAAIEQST